MTMQQLAELCARNPLMAEILGKRPQAEEEAMTPAEQESYYAALGVRMEPLLLQEMNTVTVEKYTDFPQELIARMRYGGGAHDASGNAVAWDCESYEPLVGGAIRSSIVILDNSQYSNGTLVKSEFRFLDELVIGGQFSWLLRRLRAGEREMNAP